MTPTETLTHEHEIILTVLAAGELEAAAIEKAGHFDAERLRQFVDFFREFVDRCHHHKEERHLFIRLEAAAPQAAGPIAMMLREHDQGRRFLEPLQAATEDPAAVSPKVVAETLLAYCDLLRCHILKEDNILYPLADCVLDAEDQQEIADGFDLVESQEMGPGEHEKYHRLAHELAGAPEPAGTHR
jgi:hemerythrin-like domain-containing protein